MPATDKILIIATSHAELGATGHPTGAWHEEIAAPYRRFVDAGFEVLVASPKGSAIPVDPGSMAPDFATDDTRWLTNNQEAQEALANSVALSEISSATPFAALFLVGGHGTMWDFPDNAQLGRLLADAARQKSVIGAVCHGVAGLLAAPASAGLVNGRSLTGFSNQEEGAVGLTDAVPFLLEDRLKEAGAEYAAAAPFTPNVKTDGRLVTGQNPASSQLVAEAMLAAINA